MVRRIGRVAATAVAVCLCLVVFVVATPLSPRRPGPSATPTQKARAALGAMESAFFHPFLTASADHVPASGWAPFAVARHGASLWDYSWALAALDDVASLPGGTRYVGLVVTQTDGLQNYWAGGANPPAYAPGWFPGPTDVKYFDDNAWVGLDLVQAWHLTGKAVYLQRAEAVMRYEETGWDNSGGGIYWNDKRISRNTPSTAPVAELAAYLYRATGQSNYLTWAERIYAWEVKTLVNPNAGDVWDNINPSGKINTDLWTYNQGTVIGAGVLLYEITGNATDLAQSVQTANYTLQAMVQPDGALVPQPSFNGVLADNLQLLYEATHAPAILQVITTNADLAWNQAQNSRGLFAQNWGGPPPTGNVKLLTESGAVRLLAVADALRSGGFAGFWL